MHPLTLKRDPGCECNGLVTTVMDYDSYGTAGLTKTKPPETERRFRSLRLPRSGFYYVPPRPGLWRHVEANVAGQRAARRRHFDLAGILTRSLFCGFLTGELSPLLPLDRNNSDPMRQFPDILRMYQ
jgi:hypothetical protein